MDGSVKEYSGGAGSDNFLYIKNIIILLLNYKKK